MRQKCVRLAGFPTSLGPLIGAQVALQLVIHPGIDFGFHIDGAAGLMRSQAQRLRELSGIHKPFRLGVRQLDLILDFGLVLPADTVEGLPIASGLTERALKQAARELLLAQSSDWPFILRTGTSPEYARQRVKDHLLRFIALHEQLTATSIDEPWLEKIEWLDNLFPDVNYHYWA